MGKRDIQDPCTIELSDNQSSLTNLLSNIYHNSRGSIEDQAFFKNLSIPKQHEDSEIDLIFQYCRQIQDKGINQVISRLLHDQTQKVSLKYGISLTCESPLILATNPTPSPSDRTSTNTPPMLKRAKYLDRKNDPSDLKTS